MLKNTKTSYLIAVEAIIGQKFKNLDLLTEALTHRSFLNENPKVKNSNERLEFLGDSVLSLLTSTELYSRFPHLPEGRLTSIRSNLVRTKTLADIAQKIKIGNYLLMSRGEEKSGGRENPSLLANSIEAIIGAIYLDRGLPDAQKFLEEFLYPQINDLSQDKIIYDFKSRLQEIIQEKKRFSPIYKVTNEEGPDHNKIFTVGVYVNSKLISQGHGKSKQEAEQDAARVALGQFKL